MAAKKFEFNNYDCPVEIAGHSFTLRCDTRTGDRIRGLSNDLREMAEKMRNGSATAEDAITLMGTALDEILGAGATDTIFDGKERTVDHLCDLCRFICETATEFQQGRASAKGGGKNGKARGEG